MRNYTRNTPEEFTVWTDDMFMGIPFLMQVAQYTASEELRKAFYDDAAQQVLDFGQHVWNEDARLYMHAGYTSRPEVKLPHWSRANGWAIWAMSDVLMALPRNHPGYNKVLRQYRLFVNSLVRYQNAEGFWHNVIDRADSPAEVSGTAIFTMAMARGIRYGWLERKRFLPVVMKGWQAVASEIEDDGTVHKICVGTMCSEDMNYYINRPFYDNDTHGSFAVIFAGMEVQQMLDKFKMDTGFALARLETGKEVACALDMIDRMQEVLFDMFNCHENIEATGCLLSKTINHENQGEPDTLLKLNFQLYNNTIYDHT
jgi:rhamnogalacturonyl hydrolase YesR